MPTAFKQVKNNAKTTALNGVLNNITTPLTAGVVSSSRFPAVVNGFFVTIWDKTTYPDPGDDPLMEIAFVNATTSGSMTLVRGQLNTSIVPHLGTPAVELLAVDQLFIDLYNAINALETADTGQVTLGGVEQLSNKTLITPIIASFINAIHNHTNAAGGGQLTDAALSAPVSLTKGGTGFNGQPAVGSVIFAQAGSYFYNTGFIWDEVNHRLGVNTGAPAAPGHFVGPDGSIMVLASSTNAAGAQAGLEFKYGSGGGSSTIARILANTQSGGGGDLLLQVAASGGAAYVTKLAILRNGNIGLGTQTPQTDVVVGSAKKFAIEMAPPSSPSATLAAGGSLVSGTPYFWTVTALDGSGETVGSAEVTATPSAGNLSATLAWTAPKGAVSYRVYRSTTAGVYGATSLVGTSTRAGFTDTGAAASSGTVPSVTTAYTVIIDPATGNWQFKGGMTTTDFVHAPLHDVGGMVYHARAFNIIGDGKVVNDGAMTNGSPILTSATAAFTLDDVGKLVTVQGAGSGPGVLTTTILSYQSATQVTLNANALVTVTGKEIFWSTNDTTAIAALFDTLKAAGGGRAIFNGKYGFGSGVVKTLAGSSIILEGTAENTEFRVCSNTQSNAGGLFDITGGAAVAADYFALRNIRLVGNTTGGMGLRLTDCFNGDLYNVRGENFRSVGGWGVAINMGSQVIGWTVINLTTKNNVYCGLQLGSASNANTFIGGWHYQNLGGAGVRISAANNNVFLGTIFEGNDYGAIFGGGRGNKVINGWFESNTTDGLRASDIVNVAEDCWFTTNGVDIHVLSGSLDTQFTRNNFFDGGKITIDSGADRVNIYKNTNLTTVTDNSAAGAVVNIEDNQGFNPNTTYAGGNITGTPTINRLNGSKQRFTQTGNITPTITNGKANGDRLVIDITTAGFTQTWPANVRLAGGAFAMTGRSKLALEWDKPNSLWVEESRAAALA